MPSNVDIDSLRDEFGSNVLEPWIAQNFQGVNVEDVCKCFLPPVIALLARCILINQIPGKEEEGKAAIVEYFRQFLDVALAIEKASNQPFS